LIKGKDRFGWQAVLKSVAEAVEINNQTDSQIAGSETRFSNTDNLTPRFLSLGDS
jgi:hypothetical protein